ncbi:helix-turn-helix domain-containing protein [Mycobacterium avium]|nr:helix-turn-helix domain-containing protein [Mycobacterium avium]
MVKVPVLKPPRIPSAESSVLAARMAKSGGSSGKIRVMSWERLADEVRLRRKQLKLTQPDVAERGGLSVATVRAVETNRSGRLSRRLRRALERALEWQDGSIDAVLDGGPPRTVAGSMPTVREDTARAAAERFAVAQRLVKMRQAFLEHRDEMPEAARTAMENQFSAASRETEEALIWMLPWLGEDERTEAIRILAELREVRR